MKSKTRILSILVVVALLASVFGVIPVSAAAGTVAVSKDFVTTPATGGAVTVTLTDSDLEQGVTQTAEATDASGNVYAVPGGLGAGATFFDRVQKFPVLNSAGAAAIFSDVTVVTTTANSPIEVLSVSSADGLITFQNTGAQFAATGGAFAVTYIAADVQTHTAKLSSGSDAAGFNITLRETGPATGVFAATFDTATSTANATTTLMGVIQESAVNVDFSGNGTTTQTSGALDHTPNLIMLVATSTAPNNSTTDTAIVDAMGVSVAIDFDGDTYVTSTIYYTSTFSELTARQDVDGDGRSTSTGDVLGVDLNGDGDATDTAVSAGTGGAAVTDFSKRLNERIARIDLDADGVTTGTADIQGVDLNGDGDATDFVTSIYIAALPESPIRPSITATAGDLVTISYTDASPAGTVSKSVTVEDTDPTVKVTSPIDEAATQIQTQRLEVEVTDSDSGVDKDSIGVTIVSATDALGAAVAGIGTLIVGEPLAVAGGFTASFQLTEVPTGETTITYNVTSNDNAGNVGTSDSDEATEASDNHVLKIDTVAPGFAAAGAETGHNWDADAKAVVTDPTKADDTKIAVYFNEELDGTSLARTDFEVDISGSKSTPAAYDWYEDSKTVVFLTVPTMAADLRPNVGVVAAISDKAGNPAATIGAVTASDGIGPDVAVTVSSSSLSTKTFTIDISSDERLLTAPTVRVNGGTVGLTAVASAGTNLFRTTFESATTNAYNLEVTAKDTAGNEVTLGKAAHDTADAIVMEVDNTLPAPTTLPIDAANTVAFSGSPLFLEINYTAEAKEYGLDVKAGALSTTTGNIVVDLDTHGAVAITAVTLDGVDVSSQLDPEGEAKYVLALGVLAEQTDTDYVLKFTGEDDAGNTAETELKFTVEERPQFEIPLTTGWNLISLPGALAAGETGINDAIPSTHPIDTVVTYDPTDPQKWLVATRLEDLSFDTDEISDIELGQAYWVRTTSFESLKVSIPGSRGGTNQTLPIFSMSAGWNLMPVLDVTGDLKATEGEGFAAASYLANVTQTRVYGYDEMTDKFEVEGANDILEVGRGYWVWLSVAGTLVP